LRARRGLTFITVLVVLAVAGAIFWFITYGEAYWDNLEVKHLVSQAANMSYRERDPKVVKLYIIRKLHELFDEKVEDHGRIVTVTKIDFDEDDVRVERSEIPLKVDVWCTYNRTVKIPLVGGTRTLQFVNHAEQELSPVKW
jgi:hypothetical protein